MEYLEEYRIFDRHLGISRADNEYAGWVGGCRVTTAPTIEIVRDLLLIHIKTWANVEIDGLMKSAVGLRRDYQKLVNHPAGLLHFITKYPTMEAIDEA